MIEPSLSSQERIQVKLIDAAKDRLFCIDKTVPEIGLELGFKYPQYFTRVFMKILEFLWVYIERRNKNYSLPGLQVILFFPFSTGPDLNRCGLIVIQKFEFSRIFRLYRVCGETSLNRRPNQLFAKQIQPPNHSVDLDQ